MYHHATATMLDDRSDLEEARNDGIGCSSAAAGCLQPNRIMQASHGDEVDILYKEFVGGEGYEGIMGRSCQ